VDGAAQFCAAPSLVSYNNAKQTTLYGLSLNVGDMLLDTHLYLSCSIPGTYAGRRTMLGSYTVTWY